MLAPRAKQTEVPELYDAKDAGTAYRYAMDVEDWGWLSEGDKARALTFARKSIQVIDRSRRPPCRFWMLRCKGASLPTKSADER